MPHGYSDRNAKRLHRYTGLTHAQAQQVLKDRAGRLPRIAESTGSQRLLEALVFEHMGGDVDYFAHPIGISSIIPHHDSLVIALDASSTRHGYPLVAHALDGLLPAELPQAEQKRGDVRVIGVPGIRITRVSRKGLRLSLAGAKASVFLTCGGMSNWKDLLADRRAQLEATGYRPCWNEAEMTPPERAFHQDHAEMSRAVEKASWLPSGLLRRSGLFYEVSTAYCTRYWVTWDQWRIELKHDLGVRPAHDAFVDHLTDSRWGMGLAVDKLHCECDAPWADPHYDRQCTVELSSHAGRPGALQVRFRAMGTWCNSYDTYRDLKRAGADPAWLRRVMPRHHHRSQTDS